MPWPWPWPWQLTSEGANSLDATRMQTSLEDCIDIGYMLIEYMVKWKSLDISWSIAYLVKFWWTKPWTIYPISSHTMESTERQIPQASNYKPIAKFQLWGMYIIKAMKVNERACHTLSNRLLCAIMGANKTTEPCNLVSPCQMPLLEIAFSTRVGRPRPDSQ